MVRLLVYGYVEMGWLWVSEVRFTVGLRGVDSRLIRWYSRHSVGSAGYRAATVGQVVGQLVSSYVVNEVVPELRYMYEMGVAGSAELLLYEEYMRNELV